MPAPAASAAMRSEDPDRASTTLRDAVRAVRRPSGAVLFVSGSLASRVPEVAEAAASVADSVPTLVVPGAGVLTEAEEIEDQAGAAAIAWSGGEAEPIATPVESADEIGEALARLVADRAGRTNPGILVFAKADDGFGPQTLEPLRAARGNRNVFGAGTVGSHGAIAIDASGQASGGGAVGFVLRGIGPPIIRSSHACRMLGGLKTITETRGAMVVALDDEPALDVLSAMGEELVDQPLVFAVLAPEEGATPEQGGRPPLLIRAVRGVDPKHRSLLVSDEVREGMRLTFAIRDGLAARRDLETVTREIEREIAGAAPRFAIYLNCAGRGASLYNAANVDTRILTARFGNIPMAGMQSSFEIAPHVGRPAVQLYTGVLALFTAPS